MWLHAGWHCCCHPPLTGALVSLNQNATPSHTAGKPALAYSCIALLVAQSHFTHISCMCVFSVVNASTSRMLATRSTECNNARLLKQHQNISPQMSVLQRAAWHSWPIGLKALMFQAGQFLPEEDSLTSPLPMRQLNNTSASLAAMCGIKRVAPAAIDPGKTPHDNLQRVLISINRKLFEECTNALPHDFSWLYNYCIQSG